MRYCIFLLFIAVVCLQAQNFIGPSKPFTKETLTGNGPTVLGLQPQAGNSLLDPTRFHMRQSYSMSYTSDGTNSDMTGLYLNRLSYDFSIPLTLQVDVGLFHKPMAMFSSTAEPGVKTSTLTVPHVGLYYKPSKNIYMSFEYFQAPAGYASPYASNPFYGMGLSPFEPQSPYASPANNGR